MTDAPMTPEEILAAARVLAQDVDDYNVLEMVHSTPEIWALARKVLSQTPRARADSKRRNAEREHAKENR